MKPLTAPIKSPHSLNHPSSPNPPSNLPNITQNHFSQLQLLFSTLKPHPAPLKGQLTPPNQSFPILSKSTSIYTTEIPPSVSITIPAPYKIPPRDGGDGTGSDGLEGSFCRTEMRRELTNTPYGVQSYTLTQYRIRKM